MLLLGSRDTEEVSDSPPPREPSRERPMKAMKKKRKGQFAQRTRAQLKARSEGADRNGGGSSKFCAAYNKGGCSKEEKWCKHKKKHRCSKILKNGKPCDMPHRAKGCRRK